jgi:hypothetical protein
MAVFCTNETLKVGSTPHIRLLILGQDPDLQVDVYS